MEPLTLGQIADFSAAELESEYREVIVNGISKDNRTLNPGDLFIAIRGETFDGHDFVKNAAQAGAVAALVSKKVPDAGIPVLVVEDTILALQAIASGYRRSFENLKVLGITGSVGKTTTKEMCASVLNEKYYTLKTLGNLNNDIGLPFTAMGLNLSHEAAVFEMGANHFGEISRLTKIARPDIAVITAIGESHIEFFGSKAGILRAKLEILEGVKPDGSIVLNGDDPLLWDLRGRLGVKTVYCGMENEQCDIFGEVKYHDTENITFSIRGVKGADFHINCGGMHNLKNALLAVGVGIEFGCSFDEIRAGLEDFKNTGLRQKIIKTDKFTIISDCYNASPDSMQAALKLLKTAENSGKKIAVLGDMLELGEHSPQAHYRVGEIVAECADMVFAAGNWSEDVIKGAQDAGLDKTCGHSFKTVRELIAKLKGAIGLGDILLVKGSRGMRMEQVIEEISDNKQA